MRHGRKRLTITCGDNGGLNRLGLPCQCKQLYKRAKENDQGRCKFHGGMLAGPKTPEGWARAIKAGIEALERYRLATSANAKL